MCKDIPQNDSMAMYISLLDDLAKQKEPKINNNKQSKKDSLGLLQKDNNNSVTRNEELKEQKKKQLDSNEKWEV